MAMSRMTRSKAAEVAEALHVEEDALLMAPDENGGLNIKALTPEPTDRAPLGELAPNSADSKSLSDDAGQELKKSARSKKGGRKPKSKKNNFAASTTSQAEGVVIDDEPEVIPDDNDSAPSPASEKAADDLMKDVAELNISDMPIRDDIKPKNTNAAVKLTRSQLAKQAELNTEPKTLVDGLGQTPDERQQAMKEETVMATNETPEIKTSKPAEEDMPSEAVTQLPIDAPASPLPSAMPNIIANLRQDTPAKRSTSNKENVEPECMASPQPAANYDALEHAVVEASTPPSQSAPRPEDPISALDDLDDAVETISKDIPDVPTSPEKKSKAKKSDDKNLDDEKESKKAAPVVRSTKASQARMSLAQNTDSSTKAPALGRPRPSIVLGRSSSVRQTGSKPEPFSKRVLSGSTSKDTKPTAEGEKKEVVIPHSKPRPISMSFPTPPPPAKSTKAPTQSTFQLSGDAVAAKLKAAREARQQKESEEEDKKKTFKARPVPASLNKAPSVRHTNTSKARESVMNGKDLKSSTSTLSAAHKRANSVATARPTTAPKPRVVSKDTSKPAAAVSTLAPGEVVIKKRPSTAMANMSKPRSSFATSTSAAPTSQRIPSNPTKGTVKGKEVFNRAANAKAAAEKEKFDKEAAAKKARAEAAERGRQASREWAEKQKQKKQVATTVKDDTATPEATTVGSNDVSVEPAAVETPITPATVEV